MTGTRLSISLANADTRQILDFARAAESVNLGIWIGSPTSDGKNSDDSYVMAAAAAAAGATTHIRLGVFLTLCGSANPLRLAEDLGVVDQASGGRIEAAFVFPGDDQSSWERKARDTLGAWQAWPTNTGRIVAATPRPCQPWMPRLVVGDRRAIAMADRLRGGVVLVGEQLTAGCDESDALPRRCVQVVEIDTDGAGVRGWLAHDPIDRVRDLRAWALRSKADELLVRLNVPEMTVDDIRTLGIAVAPALRSSAHHADHLALDAWKWLTESTHLHTAPC